MPKANVKGKIIKFLEEGLAIFFYEEPDSKHFDLCRPYYLPLQRAKTIIENMYKSENDCVVKKLYL